jgi:hypothetical protein
MILMNSDIEQLIQRCAYLEVENELLKQVAGQVSAMIKANKHKASKEVLDCHAADLHGAMINLANFYNPA